MENVLSMIQEGIHEIFPDSAGFDLIPDTMLNHIPDWDSMSSVNFKVFLEETFRVSVPDDLLEGGSTIGDIIAHIRKAN